MFKKSPKSSGLSWVDVVLKKTLETLPELAKSLERIGWINIKTDPSDNPVEASKSPPLNIRIGYVEGVDYGDIKDYVLVDAKRYFMGLGDLHYGVYPFKKGWAFEVQEGGHGLGILAAILEDFKLRGNHASVDSPRDYFINTTSKTMLVELHDGGVFSYVLPESDRRPDSDEIVLSSSLRTASKSELTELKSQGVRFMVLSSIVFVFALMLKPTTTVDLGKKEAIRQDKSPYALYLQNKQMLDSSEKSTLVYENKTWKASN